MLHAQFHDHMTLGPEGEFKGYGYGGHLSQLSKTIFTKYMFPLPKEALIGQVVSKKKMFGKNGHVHVRI